MFVKYVLVAASAFAASAPMTPAARADTLDVPAARQAAKKPHHRNATRRSESDIGPSRGMSMAQVEKRYGAPIEKLPAAGGDKPHHPLINRWRYAGYTVYFERSRVIHSVPDATAPAPAS
jgi:hypothetical protein